MFREFDNRMVLGLEGAKQVAIVLMARSHFGLAFNPDWTWAAFWVGRFCAPAFCFIIVARLAEKPESRAPRHLTRLLAWA